MAARILSEPFFAAIINDLREDAIGQLIDGQDGREDHIAMIRALDNFRLELQSIVTTGKNAAKRLE